MNLQEAFNLVYLNKDPSHDPLLPDHLQKYNMLFVLAGTDQELARAKVQAEDVQPTRDEFKGVDLHSLLSLQIYNGLSGSSPLSRKEALQQFARTNHLFIPYEEET